MKIAVLNLLKHMILFRLYKKNLLKIVRSFKRIGSNEEFSIKFSTFEKISKKMMLKPIGLSAVSSFGFVPSKLAPSFDLFVRQYLSSQIYHSQIAKEFIRLSTSDVASVSMAIPSVWRSYLLKHSIPVNHLKSLLKLFKLQLLGLVLGIRRSFGLLKRQYKGSKCPTRTYAVICSCPLNAIPIKKEEFKNSYKLVTWYRNSPLYPENCDLIWVENGECIDTKIAGLEVHSASHPQLSSKLHILKFIWNVLLSFLWVIVRYSTGAWWAPIIFPEIISLLYVKQLKKEELACAYLFEMGAWQPRPLWTYYVSSQGSRVQMAYYSSNMYPLRYKNGFENEPYPYTALLNWPEAAVWTHEQKDYFTQQAPGKGTKFHVVGSVALIDSNIALPELPKNFFAIFDINAHRQVKLASMGYYNDYLNADTICAFLEDVVDILTSRGVNVALKRKRYTNQGVELKYKNTIEALMSSGKVIEVDARISPERLIKISSGVISLPFTSTSLVGSSLNKPSIFYDPCAILATDSWGTRGTPLISGREALENWVSDVGSDF